MMARQDEMELGTVLMPARLLFVVYGREATRINGNHQRLTSNVMVWWTSTYGIYRQPPRTVGR
jgi:hypothetical protein